MHNFLYVMISVGVAALIGGVTNYLAIKMLFHPRRKVYIGSRKLPFTPGLIPKRKEEIATSLGKVVGEYLVTSDGLKGMVTSENFRLRLQQRIDEVVMAWTEKEDNLETWFIEHWGQQQWEKMKAEIGVVLQNVAKWGISYIHELGEKKTLAQMIPLWSAERKQQWAHQATMVLTEELEQYLDSPQGEEMIKRLIGQFIEQGGGVLGLLAGAFIDPDRMLAKVKPTLVRTCRSSKVRNLIESFVMKQLERAESMTLDEAARLVTGDSFRSFLEAHVERMLPLEEWMSQFASKPIRSWLAPCREWLRMRIPSFTNLLITVMSAQMDRIIHVLELPALVSAQVRKFPVERLEEIILNVSGREFRAITWLGALLGGFIGLMQSTMLLWFR